MAVLCAKCNAEVPAGAQFCSACGTSVATVPTPAYTPVAAPMQPTPASSGGGAVKVILIVLAIVVGLGILAAGAFGFFIWRVSHAIRVAERNGAVTLHTPGGNIVTSGEKSFSAGELGADIYPGAQAVKGGMRMDLPSGTVVTGAFETSDSKDAVVNFYKSKLGSDASVYDSGNGAMLTAKKGENETVMVTVSAEQSENSGKTKFVIVHTTNKKAS